MMNQARVYVTVALPLLILVCLPISGCGEAPGRPPVNLVTEPDVGYDDADEGWENNGEVPGQVQCPDIQSLGVLAAGSNAPVEMTFERLSGSAQQSMVSCLSDDAEPTGRKALSFSVEEVSKITVSVITALEVEIHAEWRHGTCPDHAVTSCEEGRRFEDVFVPGFTYVLVLDVLNQGPTGAFSVRFDVEPQVCVVGNDECVDGELARCVEGTEISSRPCADGLCGADGVGACKGDTCADAIPIALTRGGGAVVSTGHRRAYDNQWDADGRAGCGEPGDGGIGAPSLYEEMFFEVSGLRTGATLSVTSKGQGTYRFHVLTDCAAEGCIHSMNVDENFDIRLLWQVPAQFPDKAIIVIESTSAASRDFEFEFRLQ